MKTVRYNESFNTGSFFIALNLLIFFSATFTIFSPGHITKVTSVVVKLSCLRLHNPVKTSLASLNIMHPGENIKLRKENKLRRGTLIRAEV